MRLSTVFASSAFILAGVSTAFPLAKENMLEARFADSDFLSQVEARAFDDEHEFYARGRDGPRSSPIHRRKLPSQGDLGRRSHYVLYDDELVARGGAPSKEHSLKKEPSPPPSPTTLPPMKHLPPMPMNDDEVPSAPRKAKTFSKKLKNIKKTKKTNTM